ncbi:hypothetical protein E1B28_013721 [Marasmius oreades]|uniref:Uncharacterized protein n=1 Tax=Marasmius oreades TaxID=181124 RepID=A0A9P7RQE1_9AGAR|nr:uncharacterized protein E1B28_013721 [Marasmius oreades]KAG7087780.1 hypothetical protein E1B28_013721 [Marasmius oreades]
MLSSLSSFLPSALHLHSQSDAQNTPQIDVEYEEDDAKEEDENTNTQQRKKEKKEKTPHETFIFVRPPPAKSNHPLNLQVQLVPRNARQRKQSIDSRTDASDAEYDASGARLNRTPSIASEASGYSTTASGHGSTSSFASYSSTTSASGGRRMIIPLYNLQAHNVMTNTIVDAGTDAKIAKFQKRGLEMIDLAMLEPVEVWVTPSGAAMSRGAGTTITAGDGTRSARGSLDVDPPLRNRLSFLDRPGTTNSPESSAISLSSAGDHHHQLAPSTPATSSVPKSPLPPTPSTPNSAAKKTNIFGKIFDRKRKEPSVTDGSSTPDVKVISPTTPTSPPPPSPNPNSRHTRGLSASLFKRSTPTTPTFPTDPDATPNPNNENQNQKSNGLGLLKPSTGVRKLANLTVSSSRPTSSSGSPSSPSTSDEKNVNASPRRSLSRTRDMVDVDQTPMLEPAPGTGTGSRFSTMSQHSTASASAAAAAGQGQGPATPIPTLPPTLGITPTLSTPGGPSVLTSTLFSSFSAKGYPPPKESGFGKGPAMYVWVVRRWYKGVERGLLDKGLVGLGIRGIGSEGHGPEAAAVVNLSQIEVRVEWKRGGKRKMERMKERKRRETERGEEERSGERNSGSSMRDGSSVGGRTLPNSSNPSLHAEDKENRGEVTTADEKKKKNRLSAISIGSLGASSDGGGGGGSLFRRGSRKRSGTMPVGSDLGSDGEDSDPEDSETPWGCTVKVRRLGATTATPIGSSSNSKVEPLKVKAGTLSPTPHHPKVVAMLKVPFPLPDVEVERMRLRKREGGRGGGGTLDDSNGGLVLTAEEIKDVICSTGLWIVVREGFGGVGKVSRKGDGWRIRA